MKHPLEMKHSERVKRKEVIGKRMMEIEKSLKSKIADSEQPNVFPALETEWARLDTERRQIEELGG